MYGVIREKEVRLVGVSGWLAFLVIILLFLGPVIGLVTIHEGFAYMERAHNAEAYPAWQQYRVVIWCLFVVSAFFSVLSGYRLFMIRNRASVRFCVYAIWLAWPIMNMVSAVVEMLLVRDAALRSRFFQSFCVIFLSVLIAVIWTVYLKRSVRVKNTYGLPWDN